MKRRLIVSSFLTIALCLSLIAGSTFALFTSESQAKVAVTSAKVKLTALVENDAITKKFGDVDATAAMVDEKDPSTIKVVNFAPKDSISVALKIKNESSIAIKYRLSVICTDDFGGALKLTSAPIALDKWYSAKAAEPVGDNGIINVTLEYLFNGDEDLQMPKNAEFTFKVEAVQANGVVEKVHNHDELKDALSGSRAIDSHPITIVFEDNIVISEALSVNGNFVIDTNGKSISTATDSGISTVKFPFVMADNASLSIESAEGVTHSLGYLGLVEIPQNVSANVSIEGGMFLGKNTSDESGALITIRDNSTRDNNSVNVEMNSVSLSTTGIQAFSSKGMKNTNATVNVQRCTFASDIGGIWADACKLTVEDTKFETSGIAIMAVGTKNATVARCEIILGDTARVKESSGVAVANNAKLDIRETSITVPFRVPAYRIFETSGQINVTNSVAHAETLMKIHHRDGTIVIDNVVYSMNDENSK